MRSVLLPAAENFSSECRLSTLRLLRLNRPKRQYQNRRGVAVVEMALIAPLFLLLTLSIIEFGRALMVQQILTNSSREGSRRAIVEGATESEVRSLVQDYLQNASITGATVSVAPTSLTNLGFGDPATVTVSVPFDQVSWFSSPFYLGGRTLEASTTMRGERLQ